MQKWIIMLYRAWESVVEPDKGKTISKYVQNNPMK
jgi:hypothetical protein